MVQLFTVQSYNEFIISMQSGLSNIIQVQDSHLLHQPQNKQLFPEVDSKLPQIDKVAPLRFSQQHDLLLSQHHIKGDVIKQNEQKYQDENPFSSNLVFDYAKQKQIVKAEIGEYQDIETSEDSSEHDYASNQLNPIVPWLFPKMDIDDDNQFCKTDTLPLTPSYICK